MIKRDIDSACLPALRDREGRGNKRPKMPQPALQPGNFQSGLPGAAKRSSRLVVHDRVEGAQRWRRIGTSQRDLRSPFRTILACRDKRGIHVCHEIIKPPLKKFVGARSTSEIVDELQCANKRNSKPETEICVRARNYKFRGARCAAKNDNEVVEPVPAIQPSTSRPMVECVSQRHVPESKYFGIAVVISIGSVGHYFFLVGGGGGGWFPWLRVSVLDFPLLNVPVDGFPVLLPELLPPVPPFFVVISYRLLVVLHLGMKTRDRRLRDHGSQINERIRDFSQPKALKRANKLLSIHNRPADGGSRWPL